MTKKEETAVLGVGLAASILGGLALAAANSDLKTQSRQLRESQEALNSILADWQASYGKVRLQLFGAQRVNRELTKQNEALAKEIDALRAERDEFRQSAYDAKQRAVELESLVAAAQLEHEKTKRELLAARAAPSEPRKPKRQGVKRRKRGGEATT